MMTTRTVSAEVFNDAELVAESLAGNRDAFGQIIARYQSLVCSLAYSGTGSLSQSEDLAQETFVVAWASLHSRCGVQISSTPRETTCRAEIR
jgi:DNA-directed RNA polymerase specialized sigma24 family protein